MDSSSNLISVDSEHDQPAARNITRMHVALYKAAARGKIEEFDHYRGSELESLLTRNDNTVLHVYLATGKYGLPLVLMAFWILWPFSLTRRGRFLSVVRIRYCWELKTSFSKQILDKCPSLLLQPNAKGQTPLHFAARYGHSTIVRFLINHRAKSSREDRENQRNEFEAVREMLRKTDEESNTALHVAVERGHLQVVNELLELEDPDFPYSANRNQETPLYIAARRRYHSLLTTMLHKFKSPAHGGPNGRTVLHAAAMAGNKSDKNNITTNEFISDLRDQKDSRGITPLDVYDAVHACLIEERVPLKRKNKMKQLAELLEGVEKEEVADKPVRPTVRYRRFRDIEKAKEYHLVVAILIASVAFAAAITVLRGFNSENSWPDQQATPSLIRNAAFKAFVISDALAFMFSLAAVILYFQMALSTVRLQLKFQFTRASDFIIWALYASVVAFSTCTYAMLQGPSPGLAITSCCIGFGVGFLV